MLVDQRYFKKSLRTNIFIINEHWYNLSFKLKALDGYDLILLCLLHKERSSLFPIISLERYLACIRYTVAVLYFVMIIWFFRQLKVTADDEKNLSRKFLSFLKISLQYICMKCALMPSRQMGCLKGKK